MKKSFKPPVIAEWLLNFLGFYEGSFNCSGDFRESYFSILKTKGIVKAKWWYWSHVIRSMITFTLIKITWGAAMFKNYFKISFRNFKKRKGFTFINIFGLSIGIACCIFTLVIAENLLTVNSYEKSDNLFRIAEERGHGFISPYLPIPLGPAVKEDISGIRHVLRWIESSKSFLRYKNVKFYEEGLCFVDPTIFEMFDFPLLYGDTETALSKPMSIVIDEDIAKKYFGNENPIGKILSFNNEYDVVVGGVLKNIPEDSYLQFKGFLPLESFFQDTEEYGWNHYFIKTYLTLEKNVSYNNINIALKNWSKNHVKDPEYFFIEPFENIPFSGVAGTELKIMISLLSLVAIVILLVGCFNFMNLSTARANLRINEIGLRKVMGAARKDLINQYLGESLMLSCLALFIALFLVKLIVSIFNSQITLNISDNIFKNPRIIIGSLLITIFTGIISGSYPALFLSSFQPVKALSGILRSGPKALFLRRLFVVVQFSVSFIFIMLTVITSKQISHMKKVDLGFDKNNVIVLSNNKSLSAKYSAFVNELVQKPYVAGVSAGSKFPTGVQHTHYGGINWEGKDQNLIVPFSDIYVDYNYLDLFGMEIVHGRNFSREVTSDKSNFIINEAAVKALGFENPLGKQISFGKKTAGIIGVVKDYHFGSINEQIHPLLIMLKPAEELDNIFIKIKNGNVNDSIMIGSIERIWNKFAPEYPFDYRYLNDIIKQETREIEHFLSIFKIISFITILISCLGMFALASYITSQQIKQIAVRKVFGASIKNIIVLLSKDFIKSAVISMIIAIPISWITAFGFFQSMVHKTRIGPELYLFTAFFVLIIVFATVSYQVFKVAVSNPAISLRHE